MFYTYIYFIIIMIIFCWSVIRLQRLIACVTQLNLITFVGLAE